MAIPKQDLPSSTSSDNLIIPVEDEVSFESVELKGEVVGYGSDQMIEELPRLNKNTKRNKKRGIEKRFLALILLLLLVAVACLVLLSKRSLTKEEITSEPIFNPVPYYETSDNYEVKGDLNDEDLQAARRVTLAYFNSADMSEASQYILGTPDKFIEYYQPLIKSQAQFAFSHGFQYSNGARSAVFNLSLAKGHSIELHAFAHPNEDFRVDWRSLYLLEDGLTLGEVKPVDDVPQRVKAYITPNYFYLPDFPADEYQSLLLQNYARQLQFPAYVKKGDVISEKLATAFQSSDFILNEGLCLRGVITLMKKGKGYVIKELHSEDWTNLETFSNPSGR